MYTCTMLIYLSVYLRGGGRGSYHLSNYNLSIYLFIYIFTYQGEVEVHIIYIYLYTYRSIYFQNEPQTISLMKLIKRKFTARYF